MDNSQVPRLNWRPAIANSPAVSGLLIGGPNELPAWAADPSSIYRATNERRDEKYSVKSSQLAELPAVE
ncbi:hypothetical protein T06_3119 [Trichinella sp. T6]|nr:hypothetical protein T06_3119 [Trichinella sp. T6]